MSARAAQSAPATAAGWPVPPPSSDPLYAVAAPGGQAAIATFLLDGQGALARLAPIFHGKRALSIDEPGQLVFGKLTDPNGAVVDEAIAAPLAAKSSSTDFEQIELSCHGGAGAVEAVRRLLESAGFRAERRGELAARAHRAARLSLIALEARLRLERVHALRQTQILLLHTEFQARWERLGLDAGLGARSKDLSWREKLYTAARDEVARFPRLQALLRAHRVAVLGPVNAGKSTLVNKLLRADLSIVSAEPGTTRDRLERDATLRGLSIALSDTAGLRALSGTSEGEELERAGQARAEAAAQEAELVLLVQDGSVAPSDEALALLAKIPAGRGLLVLNKADLGLHPEADGWRFAAGHEPQVVSALTGEGLEKLEARIAAQLLGAEGEDPVTGGPFTQRQHEQLTQLQRALQEGLDGMTIIRHIRALIGGAPHETELAKVFAEANEVV